MLRLPGKRSRESLVLLKNDNAALPIAKNTPKIFIAGQGADDIGMMCGGWTISWQGQTGNIDIGTTIMNGIKTIVSPDTTVVYNTDGNFTEKAHVGIVVVGEMPYAEGLGDKADSEPVGCRCTGDQCDAPVGG